MQVKRKPSDAYELEIETLFDRWVVELDELEAALGAPKTKSHEPGAKPGTPPSEAWRAEMQERRDRLHPLAREMAEVYLARLDAAGRRRAQEMIAAHTWVRWQFEGMCSEYFKRALQSHAQGDIDVALAMIALYDERAAGRDFSRLIHPFFVGLQQRGIDAAGVFRDRLGLTEHGDPERGARALFLRCATAAKDAET